MAPSPVDVGDAASDGLTRSRQKCAECPGWQQCGWVEQVYVLLAGVEAAQWTSILSSHVLGADETPVSTAHRCRKDTVLRQSLRIDPRRSTALDSNGAAIRRLRHKIRAR